MGAAFDRLLARLEIHAKPVVGTGTKRMASCPGPGHWRGDVHPSQSVSDGGGKVLLHCHGGCSSEDVLTVLGLTPGDLYDEPPQRPGRPLTRGKAETATAKAALPMAEKLTLMMLLRRAHNETLAVPDWRTPTMPELAGEVTLSVRQTRVVLKPPGAAPLGQA